jgi:hypothetical protein
LPLALALTNRLTFPFTGGFALAFTARLTLAVVFIFINCIEVDAKSTFLTGSWLRAVAIIVALRDVWWARGKEKQQRCGRQTKHEAT